MGFETSTGRAELPVEALMFMGRNGKDCEWSLWTLWGSRDISGPLSLLFEETAGIFLVYRYVAAATKVISSRAERATGFARAIRKVPRLPGYVRYLT